MYVEQASSSNTTEVTQQQCSVFCRGWPTNDLKSPQGHNTKLTLDVTGHRSVKISSMGATPLKLVHILGTAKENKDKMPYKCFQSQDQLPVIKTSMRISNNYAMHKSTVMPNLNQTA